MLSLADHEVALFGRAPLKAAHRLHQLPLFEDAALVDLLDRMPRQNLFALTMGHDPARADQRRPASHEGVSGRELLEAVKRGRLWLNVTRVDSCEPAYRKLLDEVFAELSAKIPGLRVDGRKATLLISSPNAQVYYHADAAPTVLWHLRGSKRIFLYPANDERFLSRHDLEDIFAGVRTEYVPWQPEFDAHAVFYDLEPGELAAWPQNAPHRVVNHDSLNVSLSSEYFTPQSRSRARLFNANRFLRKTLRLGDLPLVRRLTLGTDEGALSAAPRIAAHRLGKALRLDERNTRRHVPVVRVDPAAPSGVSAILPELSVRCSTRLDELLPHRDALDALNAQSHVPDAFATFAYYQNLLAAAPATRLRFLTAWEGERPVGYLALRQTEEVFWGAPHSKLEFLAARDVDAPRLICRPGDEARCAAALYRHLLSRDQEWSMLELRQQYPDSPLLRVPQSEAHRLRLFESKENATIPLGQFGSLGAFHKACSKKHRNNVSRAVRQLLGKGVLEHVFSDDPAATPALLELYATLERRSWKDRAGSAVGRSQERAALLRRLLAPHQPMRISVELLLLDGIPVAGLVNGAFGKTLYALQIVHDESLADLSPGTVALLLGVRRGIEGGFARYNLLSGYSYYKARWLAEVQQSQSVQIFRAGKAHFWKALVGDVKRRVLPPAAPAAFNLVKRETAEAGHEPISAAERARIAALLQAVPRDRAVWLSAEDLQRVMPFETRDGFVRAGA